LTPRDANQGEGYYQAEGGSFCTETEITPTDLQEPATPRVHRAQEAMDGHAHPVQVQPLVGDLGFGAESPAFNQGSTPVNAHVFTSVVGLRAKATLECRLAAALDRNQARAGLIADVEALLQFALTGDQLRVAIAAQLAKLSPLLADIDVKWSKRVDQINARSYPDAGVVLPQPATLRRS